MSFTKFFFLFENFETVSKLFLDPAHRDKEWFELNKEFEKSGGRHIGSGSYGSVLTHPKWPYVVKMFPKDDPYLKFARYAYKNPHKSFPKFYGAPKKIIPQYTRSRGMGEVYLSRIEKLNPISKEIFHVLEKYKPIYNSYMYMVNHNPNARRFYGTNYQNRLNELKDELKDIPENIRSALDAMNIVNEAGNKYEWGADDWKINNIMQRDNGDIVLIDPVWEGWNPHMEAERQRQEYDLADYDEDYPPMVRGGELPKKINPKKYKPAPPPQLKYPNPASDDYPF